MSRRASGALLAPLGSDSPVSSWRMGSISTSLQTMLSMFVSRSLSSLWRCIVKPPPLQTMAGCNDADAYADADGDAAAADAADDDDPKTFSDCQKI